MSYPGLCPLAATSPAADGMRYAGRGLRHRTVGFFLTGENCAMKLRELGTSGIHVAPLALGGNVFGWTADESTSFAVLDAFVAGGFNLIDTADVYSAWVPGHSGGESETVLGNWLAKTGNRSKVVIATKVGLEIRGEKGLSRA